MHFKQKFHAGVSPIFSKIEKLNGEKTLITTQKEGI